MFLLKLFLTLFLLFCLEIGLTSCSAENPFNNFFQSRIEDNSLFLEKSKVVFPDESSLSEVATPSIIRKLDKFLEKYQPQVSILNPKPNEVIEQDTVEVKLQVKDFPIYKAPTLDMGPNLHLILDDQPYTEIYDLTQPLVFSDLAPGSHTIRVFAARPWHESFKNEGAYAQVTFHVLTETKDNNPNPDLPLLTYNTPQGTYGSEPILLDFYLTNAPLHLVAQADETDEIKDWRIRVTINGESFLLDSWQPVYLKGFKVGNNWVQLELIDEDGNNIDNAFNDSVRLVTYDPSQSDTLAQLLQGKISFEQARVIVDPNYQPPSAEKIKPEQVEETVKIEDSSVEPEVIEQAEEENLPKPALEEDQTRTSSKSEELDDAEKNNYLDEVDLDQESGESLDEVEPESDKLTENSQPVNNSADLNANDDSSTERVENAKQAEKNPMPTEIEPN